MGEIACALQSEHEPHEGYLLVRVTGEPVVEALAQASDAGLEKAKALGLPAVLVDARGLTGALGILERFQLGLHFALHWDLAIPAAVVVTAETLNDRRFVETVARNRAVPVRFFSDPHEALAWLLPLAPPPPPPSEGL